jgi:hypothetical protein
VLLEIRPLQAGQTLVDLVWLATSEEKIGKAFAVFAKTKILLIGRLELAKLVSIINAINFFGVNTGIAGMSRPNGRFATSSSTSNRSQTISANCVISDRTEWLKC